MKLLSVNEVLESSDSFTESDVFLQGVLSCSEGNVLLNHWPKSEQTQSIYDKIWVYTGEGAYSFSREVLARIEGKRVVVHGVIKPNETIWPDEPGSSWETHLLATELTEHKVWNEQHGSD
jgi:hypothetical protein